MSDIKAEGYKVTRHNLVKAEAEVTETRRHILDLRGSGRTRASL
jgi:hypothetical protein